MANHVFSSRRDFLKVSAGAALATACTNANAAAAADKPLRARRPSPPYRVWFAPRLFDRDMDLYANMTIDAGGWLDPRLAELAGKTTLGWVYGLNHPSAKGPEDWSKHCSDAGRAWPRRSDHPAFISAGIALDEWVPPALPDNPRWLSEGLRAGRRDNPDVFIAVWTTDPRPPLIELGRDGTVDLIIVEGYTHSAASAGPGLLTSWANALRRCDALAQGGLESKTIFCFGHITAQANSHGEHLKGKWLHDRAAELKQRYPKMPGVAFYQHAAEDSAEMREIVRACDQMARQMWPG